MFERKYTPRWIVFTIDVFISFASIIISYLLRFNFEIPDSELVSLYVIAPFVVGIRILTFILARTYAGIIRYSGMYDSKRIFLTILSGSIFILFGNVFSHNYITKTYIVPTSVVIIDFITTVFFMVALRWLVKILFFEYRTSSMPMKRVVIYGTELPAIAAKQSVEQDVNLRYKVIAFIDDVEKKTKKKIEGVPIYPKNTLRKTLKEEEIDFFILAKPAESIDKKKEVIEIALDEGIRVMTLPMVENWVEGVNPKQIQRIRIEDLLERSPIVLDKKNITNQVKGKIVLVTGAAGSIGSEIVRQLIRFEPKNILLFDQAETPMYEIEINLKEELNAYNCEIIIGDVTDSNRLKTVFETFQPQIVYHAAAYKHVPMMENNPAEAIKANVKGTKMLADMAHQYGVEKFVMISTDKAVNPTNIMGATKRISEVYIQALNEKSQTSFITTRFGNVLGSNGSVIPRFRKQIESGGSITVTHPQITRFFMTIPESCQLVIEAGAMGKGGEIFIFDMGESVKIIDLAKKMIRLYGLKLGKDIQINFTGLRPGEKLYEELLANKENTIPTHHNQILVAKAATQEYEEINEKIMHLLQHLNNPKNMELVGIMKEIIPEFISKNSIYEKLDKVFV